jgi:glycosyltransferase involved in cell wall biosynthesis
MNEELAEQPTASPSSPPFPKPLRIGIDANEANIENRVGSNVYAFELIKQIELQTRNQPHLTFSVFLTDPPVAQMPPERPGWTYHIVKPKLFATQWGLPLTLFRMRKQLDLFYTPGHYAPRLCPIPYISSVMDLGYLYFPKQFKTKDLLQLKLWTKYSVKNAKRVIAISEFTKQDVAKTYQIDPNKIDVIYPAMNVTPFRRENQNLRQETFHRFNITGPYILYVGTLQPRKNLIRLIEAFESLKLKYRSELIKAENTTTPATNGKRRRRKKKVAVEHPLQGLKLVIAGKTGWLAQPILDRIAQSKEKADIILTGFVTEEQKAILYHNALCSILIGLHEGFGMPALESLVFRVVPVVSETTSLPEVVGDAGLFVNPNDTNNIMKGIDQAITLTQKQRKEFERRADQQVRKFSWEHSGKRLLEIMQNA